MSERPFVRGRVNRSGLWRLDASGKLPFRGIYVLRWYAPGSVLTGPLRRRDYQVVYSTSSFKVMWLRSFAKIANELGLHPDQINSKGIRKVARRGWLRTRVDEPDEVRLAALEDTYRAHYGGGGRATKSWPPAALDIVALGNILRGNPYELPPESDEWPTPTLQEIEHALQRLRLGGFAARRRRAYSVTPAGMELLERVVPGMLTGDRPPDRPPAWKPKKPVVVPRPRFRLLKGGRSARITLGHQVVIGALPNDWPEDASRVVHDIAVEFAAHVRGPWVVYDIALDDAIERAYEALERFQPPPDADEEWLARWEDGELIDEIRAALKAYEEDS